MRAAVEAAVLAAQRAISAYWVSQQKIPLFILKDQITPEIPQELLLNSRILPQRSYIFDHMVKNGVGAEIGTQTGAFAKTILEKSHPREFHIVDISYDQFDDEYFRNHIENKNVIIHEGFSWDVINKFENQYFDWIYLDASHAYEHVSKDIDSIWPRVKIGGYFIFNDFTNWSPLEMTHYGVMQAVSDFLIRSEGAFEVAFLALHRLGYHDLALKRLK